MPLTLSLLITIPGSNSVCQGCCIFSRTHNVVSCQDTRQHFRVVCGFRSSVVADLAWNQSWWRANYAPLWCQNLATDMDPEDFAKADWEFMKVIAEALRRRFWGFLSHWRRKGFENESRRSARCLWFGGCQEHGDLRFESEDSSGTKRPLVPGLVLGHLRSLAVGH